jgi:hypothetical protein
MPSSLLVSFLQRAALFRLYITNVRILCPAGSGRIASLLLAPVKCEMLLTVNVQPVYFDF